MTEDQLAFFRALCAPFAANELSEKPGRGNGKTLTWIDKRAIENRLDSVCGPDGWRPEYRETERGYTCRLWILVPTREGSWEWIAKEDGAGHEGMSTEDDDEKSGYTNALRRAAQDAWGIGRYLYRKGVPSYLGDLFHGAPAPAASAPPARPESGRRNGDPPARDNFRVPRVGRASFAWAKQMEEHFRTSLISGMTAECKKRGWPTLFGDLNQEQWEEIAAGAVAFLRTLDNYRGEFDGTPALEANPDFGPTPAAPPADLKTLRRRVFELNQKLFFIVNGRDADLAEMDREIQDTSHQLFGVPIGSLKNCHDGEKLTKLAAELERLIGLAQQLRVVTTTAPTAAIDDDDIPF